MGHWFGGVGVHYGVTFNFGSAKMCSLQDWRHVSLMTKIYRLLQLISLHTFV